MGLTKLMVACTVSFLVHRASKNTLPPTFFALYFEAKARREEMGKSTIAKTLGEFDATYFNSHVTLLILLLVGWVYWNCIINITSGKWTNFQIYLYSEHTDMREVFSPFSTISIVLRSSHHSVFHCLQYSRMNEKCLGKSSCEQYQFLPMYHRISNNLYTLILIHTHPFSRKKKAIYVL